MKNHKKTVYKPLENHQTGVFNNYHFKDTKFEEHVLKTNRMDLKSKQPDTVHKTEDQPGTSKSFNIKVPNVQIDHPADSQIHKKHVAKKARRRHNKKTEKTLVCETSPDSSTNSNESIESTENNPLQKSGKLSKIERETKWKARKQLLDANSSSSMNSSVNTEESQKPGDMQDMVEQEGLGKLTDCITEAIHYEQMMRGLNTSHESSTDTTGSQTDGSLLKKILTRSQGSSTEKLVMDAEIQTDESVGDKNQQVKIDTGSQTNSSKFKLFFEPEKTTSDLKGSFSARNEEVIIDIPEELVPIAPRKLVYIPTELRTLKVGNETKYDFLGAFFNFDGMKNDEILSVRKMLVQTNYAVCEKVRVLAKLKNLKAMWNA